MKRNSNLKNVIIYCRESRDDGFENYDRIETQRDILIDFCKRQDLGTIVDIIMDDNKSGTNFERLLPIKEMVSRREVDILLCKDASRLGRNILESLTFTEFLTYNNVELVFESEHYDEDTFPLIAWFNERRVKDDSIKIRRVLRHKMEEGSIVIKAPYGYAKLGNRLEVDSSAAPVIREVFDLFLKGETMNQIAYIMNSKGYPTPSQLKSIHKNLNQTHIWNRQHIARILKHRIYTGDMIYGKREKVNYKSKKYINKPEEEWIIIADHHEAIVSKDIFDAAQEKMKNCARRKSKKSGNQAFSGLIFCARCGSLMLKIQRANLKPSYVCGKSHREGRIKDDIKKNYGCSPHRVSYHDIAGLVKGYIMILLSDKSVQKVIYDELEKCLPVSDEIKKQIKYCEDKISELQKKASICYDDKLNGIIPEYLFTQKLSAINTELCDYEKSLNEQEQLFKALSEQKKTKYTIDFITSEIHKSDISHDTLSMLFEKILVFNPNEITAEQRCEYNLSGTEYELLKINGGLLFVQNYAHQ